MACPYCYARRMYDRFKWDKRLRYDPAAWLGLGNLKKPSRIFVGSTMELFHPRLNPKWLKPIMEVPQEFPQHPFIFLTTRPWELPKRNPWPENVWVGVAARIMALMGTLQSLGNVSAKVRFVSFEPLLDYTPVDLRYVNWVIIGAETGNRKGKVVPKVEWIEGIEKSADEAGIPVFEKNSLTGIIIDRPLRQEWPR